jgi:hypothetical protein
MSEETWDRVLGDIFAAMDRDAAAEGQLIALTPRLSDEQILRAWAYLAHDEASRWRARGALAHEALQRVVGRAERDGRGTAAVRQLAAELGIEPGRVYRLAQIHGVIEGGALDAGIVEVLPEMVWYDEALAAPDPAAALGYARRSSHRRPALQSSGLPARRAEGRGGPRATGAGAAAVPAGAPPRHSARRVALAGGGRRGVRSSRYRGDRGGDAVGAGGARD